MTATTKMQKSFIFLMIIWNVYTFASKYSTSHLHFFLGCRAVIPCGHKRSDSNSYKWFYMKNEYSEEMLIFFKDKNGLQHHHAFRRRGHVTLDQSLVISYFTEYDQGMYWCVNCYENHCSSEKSTVIRVTKENLNETQETVYVAAGSNFMHLCPGEFTNFKWTFNTSEMTPLRNSKVRTETDFVSSNKSIHIVNVRTADVGKYTCWTSSCNGHTHRLLTINLCVITVHQSRNSSVLCAVTCDVQSSNIKHNGMSNEETDLRKISVHVKPYGSLNCRAKQMFDAYGTINSTHAPSNASSKTTATNTQPEYLTPVIYGTSVSLTFLILIPLLIVCFRPRLWADISDSPSGCDIDGRVEDESSLVYSTVIIERPAKTTNNYINHSDCVYSEIQL